MTSIIEQIEKGLDDVREVGQFVPFQNTEEWHEARLKKFTASRAGDMMKRGKNHESKKEKVLEIKAAIMSIENGSLEKEINELSEQIKEKRAAKRGTKRDEDRLKSLKEISLSQKKEELKLAEEEVRESSIGEASLKYIHEKLAEILTNQPHIIESRATSWGHDMEDQAIEAYEELTNHKVQKVGFIEWNEYSGGSPDGLIGLDGIIEVKCPYNSANHVSVMLSQELPENHYLQVQFNMMVTKRKWCDYISYDPRVQEEPLKTVIIRVERNEEAIKSIQDRLVEVKEKLDELVNQIQ